MDYAAMGVKRLKVINQGPHADNNFPWMKLGYGNTNIEKRGKRKKKAK